MVTFTHCRRADSQGIRAATLSAAAGVMTKKEYERLEKSRGNAEQMGNHARQMRIDASAIRKNTVQNQKNATGRTPQVALTRIALATGSRHFSSSSAGGFNRTFECSNEEKGEQRRKRRAEKPLIRDLPRLHPRPSRDTWCDQKWSFNQALTVGSPPENAVSS